MSAPIIQARYEDLATIRQRLFSQHELVVELIQKLRQHYEPLERGGWMGEGSSAFFTEMQSDIFPAVIRLAQALEEAGTTTDQIVELLQTAEQEAAQQFQVAGEAGTGSASTIQTPTTPTIPPFPASIPVPPVNITPGTGDTIWDHFEWTAEGDIWVYDARQSEGGYEPMVGIQYGLKESAVFGSPTDDGFSAIGGKATAGFGVNEEGFIAGAYGEYYTGKGQLDYVFGNENLAFTSGVTGKVLAVDGFAGYKDGSIGASIGGALVSVEGEAGANVAGINVGLTGEIGLKAELGLKVGSETEVKLPFISIGISFGGAKTDSHTNQAGGGGSW